MVPYKNRFHGLASLRFVFSKGQTIKSQHFALKYAYNNRRKDFRVAVVVSKKVSKKAVVRNRIRRRLYEQVRIRSLQINKPYDIALTAYSDKIINITNKQLEKQITSLFKKAQII